MEARGLPRGMEGKAARLLSPGTVGEKEPCKNLAFSETARAEATGWDLNVESQGEVTFGPVPEGTVSAAEAEGVSGWREAEVGGRLRDSQVREPPQLRAGCPKARISLEYPHSLGSAPTC